MCNIVNVQCVLFHLALAKLKELSGSVTVASVLSEFSRCLSEISDEILFFLCFILENSCSQMYMMPKSDDMSKV